jgi:hypothetical protein
VNATMSATLTDVLTTIPPHSLEAERAVLGAILLDCQSLPRVSELLKPSDFYKETHRTIFAAIRALFERAEPVDLLTVCEELRQRTELDEVGGPAALAGLVEEGATAVNTTAYIRIVGNYAAKREVLRIAAEMGAGASNGSAASDLVAEARAKLEGLAGRQDGSSSSWTVHDGADSWDFPAPEFAVQQLLPLFGVTWWGGMPKRYKSLLLLYCCLAIACQREELAKRFGILRRPRILYLAREDGGSRIQDRREDILSAWPTRPARGAIRFLIRKRFDLLNHDHVAWARDVCRREGITMLVLDTWTALSPTASPLDSQDQAKLAAIVVQLAEDISGAVVVVDHSRKNRPEGQPLSSADIFGPTQKWAAAEHIVMLGVTADARRVEVFIEGKDAETTRFFLTVSPRGSRDEKFTYSGSVAEIADGQRTKGSRHREAILQLLQESPAALSKAEVTEMVNRVYGITLKADTVQKHISALIGEHKVKRTGEGPTTKYFALRTSDGPSSEKLR